MERFTLLGLVFIKETPEIQPVIPSGIDLLPHLELPFICILNALRLVLCATIFAVPAVFAWFLNILKYFNISIFHVLWFIYLFPF